MSTIHDNTELILVCAHYGPPLSMLSKNMGSASISLRLFSPPYLMIYTYDKIALRPKFEKFVSQKSAFTVEFIIVTFRDLDILTLPPVHIYTNL